jgi:hypothetical protein
MEKEIKYSIGVHTNFNIQNFLSYNNRTNDSYFWTDNFDMGNSFFFSSKLLNKLDNIQDIYNTATQILSIYEGIYKLLDRGRQYDTYFTLRDLFNLDNNCFVSSAIESEIYKIDIDFSKITERGEDTPINPIYILFERIVENEFLINLFFLLSNRVDYRMLYIIYDDIRYYLKSTGNNDLLNQFSKPLNSFTHTANNYEVLGFYARHGRTNHKPPTTPMSLDESMNLIFDIVVKLLKEDFKIELPSFWGLSYIDYSKLDVKKLFDK